MTKNFYKLIVFSFGTLMTIFLAYIYSYSSNNDVFVFSNISNNVDFFIRNIEGTLTDIYENDITGETLSSFKKEYITKMYILRNRAMFESSISEDNVIDYTGFNLAYSYLFGESYITDNKKIELGNLNFEKMGYAERNVKSFEAKDNEYIVNIEYIQKFGEKSFKYNVKYIIGEKGKTYFLKGFVINSERKD